MMIEEVREYWCRRLERAENYSDEHWDADERHEHSDYIDAMKCAITALTVCIEHKNPKSNADRIRQMTDEELAVFINGITGACSDGECSHCVMCNYNVDVCSEVSILQRLKE